MKKNVLILSALCFAAMTLIFSGCKKETNDPQEPAKVQTYQMSIQASKGANDNQANGPRRVISLGGDGTLTAAWENGDQVTVYNVTQSAALGGYLTAESDGVNTLLNGSLTGTVSVGDVLTLKYLSPNYADQEGTLDYISDNCDYATATVTVATVEGGAITAEANAEFANQQAIVKFTLKDGNSNTLSPTALTINNGTVDIATLTIPAETYTTNGDGVLYVAIPATSANLTLRATAADGTYTKAVTGSNAALENGQYYRISLSMTKQTAPAYKEYGPFSVSSTQKVNFAQGNLQFTRESTSVDWSTGKFSFMDHQYDYIETTADPYCTDDYANKTAIGLFGWATSNINEPVANEYYYPWETDNSDGAKYGSGITSGEVNWATAHANYDWGENTGDLGTGWRTLTAAEWTYLFDTRTVNGGTGKGKSYTLDQSVNGKPGVVLYPDNYTGDAYTTGSDWSTFEDAGCVFLPAAGYRSGTSVSDVGSYGRYWSSTSESVLSAYDVYFGGSGVDLADYDNRDNGRSVRLVKNVE